MIDPTISSLARWCYVRGFAKLEIVYDRKTKWSGTIIKDYPTKDIPGVVWQVVVRNAATEAILVCDLHELALKKLLGR